MVVLQLVTDEPLYYRGLDGLWLEVTSDLSQAKRFKNLDLALDYVKANLVLGFWAPVRIK